MLWCVASLLGCRVKCIGENESIGLSKSLDSKKTEIDGFFFGLCGKLLLSFIK